MEDLLRLQPAVTLVEWCKARGIVCTDDPVKDIVDYYFYLDTLSAPTCDGSIIFTNEEVLSVLVSWCRPYLLNVLRDVNTTLRRIVGKPNYYLGNDLIDDALSTMDWHLMPVVITECDDEGYLVEKALERGYELTLPDGSDYHDYNSISEPMKIVAEHSDCSDRYYNLYVKLRSEWDPNNDGSDSEDDESVLCEIMILAVKTGDIRIFSHACNDPELNHVTVVNSDELLRDMFYYFNPEIINVYSWLFNTIHDNIPLVLTAAYCGGHYNEVIEYLRNVEDVDVSLKDIVSAIFADTDEDGAQLFIVKNLDLLTDIIEYWDKPDESLLSWYLTHLKYTLEEFKRLWTKVKDLFVVRGPSMSLRYFASARRDDVIIYLVSLPDYPRGDICIKDLKMGFRGNSEYKEDALNRIIALL